MSDALHHFKNEGIDAFLRWLRMGAPGTVPRDLLYDSKFAEPLGDIEMAGDVEYRSRYEFGCRLSELLSPFDRREISYDRGLWTWLAAWYFEQLCPRNEIGSRSLRKEYVYVLSEARLYYRHLVRTPWFLISTHGEAARFLLLPARAESSAPLSHQSYLLDQLAARQFVIASPTLIAAANRLYTDRKTGKPKRGAGSKGRGSPRRLAIVANQLSLTFDIRDMPVDRFMKLLPTEFSPR
jgi:hypothetical protein